MSEPEAQILEHEWIEDKKKQETEYEAHPVSRSHTVADSLPTFMPAVSAELPNQKASDQNGTISFRIGPPLSPVPV